jgi:hypothetical protein
MSRRYNYYSSYNDSSWGELILWIAIVLVICLLMPSCNNTHIASEREEANMIYIEEGYCYDVDTKIIYRETIVDGGRYYDTPTYYPYINENGNYCKYENGKWVEFIKD